MTEQSSLVAGLDVEIIEIDRFEPVLARRPTLKERVFSAAERDWCENKARPAVHYALCFAAKEAVLKMLGSGFAGIRFSEVEVKRTSQGRPTPVLCGRALRRADQLGIVEMHLSLSYTHSTVVASAVAITAAARPRPNAEKTPEEELAQAFRDLRILLDSMQETVDRFPEEEQSSELAKKTDDG